MNRKELFVVAGLALAIVGMKAFLRSPPSLNYMLTCLGIALVGWVIYKLANK